MTVQQCGLPRAELPTDLEAVGTDRWNDPGAPPGSAEPYSGNPFRRRRFPSADARRFLLRATIALLLGIFASLAFTASLAKGVSFDESLQLAVGYNIWLNHDLRIEGANGDLVKRWATLPFLVSRPKFVACDDPMWKGSRAYDLGWRFFFELGNQPESLLRQGRAMIVLLGVATGMLVFHCSRELFGTIGGLVSLTVFAFSPAMLALGAVVSTDMAITLTLLASTWCIWRLLHEISVGRAIISLAAMALLVLAKPSSLVIIPIAAVMVAVKIAMGPPIVARWGGRRIAIGKRRVQGGVILVLAALHVASAWGAIWAHYEFRYAASPSPADPTLELYRLPSRDEVPAVVAGLLGWLSRTQLLPQGFLVGIDTLVGCDDHLPAFLNGNWKLGGWTAFFPYAIWVKTPLALFGLLLLGGAQCWSSRPPRRHGAIDGNHPLRPPSLYAITPHLALIACYLAIAMTEDLNIGHRHVLPIYPSLHVLAGSVALGWPKRRPLSIAAALGCLGWLIGDSFSIRPHYLSYFGPQAGGAKHGYRHLVDSSLDWGMNLPGLKRWLAEHNPTGNERVFLSYFGNDNPEHYGIKATLLPGFFEHRGTDRYALTPGYYVISASILQGVYTAPFGPWSKDYEMLYQRTGYECLRFIDTEYDPTQRAKLLKEAPLAVWLNKWELFENLRLARLCAWLRCKGPPPDDIGNALFNLEARLRRTPRRAAGPPC